MEPLIGTVLLWAVPWVPRNWLACEGQMLSITQYTTLYSLLGTTYGGDGVTNFKLPDLRGRVPVGMGSAPFGNFMMGSFGGSPTYSSHMTVDNLPSHSHDLTNAVANVPASDVDVALKVSTDAGERSIAQSNDYLGANENGGRPVSLYRGDATNSVDLAGSSVNVPAKAAPVTGAVDVTGGGAPLTTQAMQPYLAVRYIIACDGVYPQRP